MNEYHNLIIYKIVRNPYTNKDVEIRKHVKVYATSRDVAIAIVKRDFPQWFIK